MDHGQRGSLLCQSFDHGQFGSKLTVGSNQKVLGTSASDWMEKWVSVHPSGFNGHILEDVYGVSSVQEVFSHVFHVFINI